MLGKMRLERLMTILVLANYSRLLMALAFPVHVWVVASHFLFIYSIYSICQPFSAGSLGNGIT